MRRERPPRVLSIAGSDSGGGAGIQADLKTFCAHRVYGLTVVTAVTAQNTRAVTAIHPVPAEVVAAQLEAVLSDIGADAIKIGMLANPAIVMAVAGALRRKAGDAAIPIVLDPVMVAKGGDALLETEAVSALTEELMPLATVVTPNLPEAELLGGTPAGSSSTLEHRMELAERLGRLGPAIVLKGGHVRDAGGEPAALIEDILYTGAGCEIFRHERIRTRATHGTGCTLSSAIAAGLGSGLELREAVAGAIEYLEGALKAAYPVGSGGNGHGPPNHLYRWEALEG